MRQAGRQALIKTVQAHPEWTLAELCEHIEARGPAAKLLGSVTFFELAATDDAPIVLPDDGGPPIHQGRLEQARVAMGVEFDGFVRQVLVEAGGPVGAGYLRARLGGPRWKLQDSLGRLVEAGVAERRGGQTSATMYIARVDS
jgi:hypothetical protein